MRGALGAAALLLALLGIRSMASAQEPAYLHVVQAGETLASIAEFYYGQARRADVLASENGLTERSPSARPGMRLLVPYVRYHRVARGDSWARLAERYYGDPARSVALLKPNGARANVAPVEGTQLLVPYPLRYVVRASSESLASIAAHYYGDRGEARTLRAFNHNSQDRARRGQLVLVPLADLVLSKKGHARIAAESGLCPDDGAGGRVQTEITQGLPRLHEYVHDGRYVEAVALGNQLLGRGGLTGLQEISVQRELAVSYVALGRTDLATLAFARALEKQPDLELDSQRTSPRVLSALEAAKAQRR